MEVIKTYLLNCSFHGIPFIADKRFHWTERLFWLVSVALCWVCIAVKHKKGDLQQFFQWASTYVMLSSYDQFKYNAISFTVDTSYLSWETEFPAVIFCEKSNSKHHYYAKKWFGVDRDFDTDDILKGIVFFTGTLEGVNYKCIAESDKHNHQCPLSAKYYTFYVDQIRSKCNELFGFCSWNKQPFPCCDHLLPIQTLYGTCYGINSLLSSSQEKSRIPMTVSHTINTSTGTLSVELLNPDIKILALSQEAMPVYTDDSNVVMDGISTSPHYLEENNIFLSLEEVVNDKEVKSTSIERRGCRFPDENYLEVARVYSHSACIIDCLIRLQMEMCNCTHHLIPTIKYENMCDMKGLLCLSYSFDEMIKKISQCDCESSCTETQINVVGTTIHQNFMDFQNNSSTTKVNLILRAPTLRCIRRVVNGYLDLIVSMGGTAGLCVGASLLTGMEIFYYFVVRPLDDHIKTKRRGNKKGWFKNKSRYKKPPFPFVN